MDHVNSMSRTRTQESHRVKTSLAHQLHSGHRLLPLKSSPRCLLRAPCPDCAANPTPPSVHVEWRHLLSPRLRARCTVCSTWEYIKYQMRW
nr:hypothetical protein BgiMline_025195 [Biomphalaria glabrata]